MDRVDERISVIIPVYNVEQYLNRCIESVVGQTYKNLEIILVDDGSPDRCPQICDEWAEKDQRIKVYHISNGGASKARNFGIQKSTGKYIAFVDSDDYIVEQMYAVMISAISENHCDLACCGRYYAGDDYKVASKCLNQPRILTPEQAIHELLNNGCVEEAPWDKLYKRELFDGIEFPVGEINEDLVIAPHIIKRCKRIVHVAEPFYYYCYNGSSVTKSGYREKNRVMFQHMDDLSDFINEFYPAERNTVKVLKAKYAMNTMFGILQTPCWKEKYIEDFRRYRKMLSASLVQLFRSSNFSFKQKIESVLLCLNIYPLCHRIVGFLKRKS